MADAFNHCKFIGYTEQVSLLFEKIGLSDLMDDGVIEFNPSSVKGFLGQCAGLRRWETCYGAVCIRATLIQFGGRFIEPRSPEPQAHVLKPVEQVNRRICVTSPVGQRAPLVSPQRGRAKCRSPSRWPGNQIVDETSPIGWIRDHGEARRICRRS